jgi:hypothetical protein
MLPGADRLVGRSTPPPRRDASEHAALRRHQEQLAIALVVRTRRNTRPWSSNAEH